MHLLLVSPSAFRAPSTRHRLCAPGGPRPGARRQVRRPGPCLGSPESDRALRVTNLGSWSQAPHQATASPGGPQCRGLGTRSPGLHAVSVHWSHSKPCLGRVRECDPVEGCDQRRRVAIAGARSDCRWRGVIAGGGAIAGGRERYQGLLALPRPWRGLTARLRLGFNRLSRAAAAGLYAR